jgi:glycosyltransferase involved in cell wall biosynthesis
MEGPERASDRVAVIMPTYNERANIEAMVGRVRRAVPGADLLVVDDNSPDGTGEVADKLAAEDSHVHVLHRERKAGLGAAYIAGFHWALDQGYGVVVEMDADGSHLPEELPRLLDALAGADLVLGSRYVPGGTVVNWPKSREMLSRGGNTYARLMLGIKLQDATGGYRAYRAGVPGLLLPDRPRDARHPRRAEGHRGADHLRRAGARHQQDEPGRRRRSAVAGHHLGHHRPLRIPFRSSVNRGERSASPGQAPGPMARIPRWPKLA